jgi:eukaryotic-like serine/threonine-protein kinase
MIGETLGKYTIVETLGTGSMGTVYKAEDPVDGRLVAVKLVRSNVLFNAERRERFLQCILAASEIRHPVICPILEIGDENDDFFIVSPFLRGKTLDQSLEGKALPWRTAISIALSAAEGLRAVHAAGTAHRGLKPSNIWLQEDGSVVLSDCCIGRFTEIEKGKSMRPRGVEFADTIIPMGALAYMSPEQVRGSCVDFRSDIFSLGAILYEMLTGRHPFEARNSLSRMSAIREAQPPAVSSRHSGVPVELDPILDKALAKRPGDRYRTIAEMMADLEVVSKTCTTQEQDRRHSSLAAASIIWLTALIALIAAVVYYLATR